MKFDPQYGAFVAAWLKHDSWTVIDAMALMCCIDPTKSREANVYIPLCCDPSEFDKDAATEQREVLKALWKSGVGMGFHSGSNGQPKVRFPISYYLKWAEEKGIYIPWRKWADENGLLPAEGSESRAVRWREPLLFDGIFDTPISPNGASLADNSKADKPLSTTEKNTLLVLIAALCDYSAINHQERGAASRIAGLTQEIGAPVSEDTVKRWLTQIPDAVERRMK